MVVKQSKRAAGTRQRLTQLLRVQGEAAVGTLADRLGLTTLAVRKHLEALQKGGLVRYRTEARPIGRPRRLYSLTPLANDLFPQAYDQLAADVLDQVRAESGGSAVGRLFESLGERLYRRYSVPMEGMDLAARVHKLAALRDQDGFMARCRQDADGGWVISEHNCPFRRVVDANPEICAAELCLFADLLQADVQRRRWMAEAGSVCEFVIAPAGEERARSSAEPAGVA